MIYTPGVSIRGLPITWSPTIAATSGSLTSYTVENAVAYQLGLRVFYSLTFTITINGTAAGRLTATLPKTSSRSCPAIGMTNSGVGLIAFTTGASLHISRYDDVYPGATAVIVVVDGSYDAAF